MRAKKTKRLVVVDFASRRIYNKFLEILENYLRLSKQFITNARNLQFENFQEFLVTWKNTGKKRDFRTLESRLKVSKFEEHFHPIQFSLHS